MSAPYGAGRESQDGETVHRNPLDKMSVTSYVSVSQRYLDHFGLNENRENFLRMRPVLTVLLPILLVGSVMGGEAERKARVQALVKQLSHESFATRQAAYDELQDTFVRKRDIPELTGEIARNPNPEVKVTLQNLITFMEGRWRLPDKGWTNDIEECSKRYEKAFEDLGCDLAIVSQSVDPGEYPITSLDIDSPEGPIENRTGVANLILTLEPESLLLVGSWKDLTFLGTLANLEKLEMYDRDKQAMNLAPLKGLPRLRKLSLDHTEVADLAPLKGLPRLTKLSLGDTKVTDLTPLKGLPNLSSLCLDNTTVTDLTPLKGMPSLAYLGLENTGVTDLTPLEGMPMLRRLNLKNARVTDLRPLKGMSSLEGLYLENTQVTDLTPLKGLPRLEDIYLQDTKVTDLTPLKGMPNLAYLFLQNTQVTDLTPLEGLPRLRQLNLNTKVTDLTPLKGMPNLTIVPAPRPTPPSEQNSRQSPDQF